MRTPESGTDRLPATDLVMGAVESTVLLDYDKQHYVRRNLSSMELEDEFEPLQSEPLSEAAVRVINSILYARVPEENFYRDNTENE